MNEMIQRWSDKSKSWLCKRCKHSWQVHNMWKFWWITWFNYIPITKLNIHWFQYKNRKNESDLRLKQDTSLLVVLLLIYLFYCSVIFIFLLFFFIIIPVFSCSIQLVSSIVLNHGTNKSLTSGYHHFWKIERKDTKLWMFIPHVTH